MEHVQKWAFGLFILDVVMMMPQPGPFLTIYVGAKDPPPTPSFGPPLMDFAPPPLSCHVVTLMLSAPRC